MRLNHLRALAVVGAAAFALAACGSSSKASSSTNSTTATTIAGVTSTEATTTPTTAGSGSTTVSVATTKLGKVLVDAKGMTLYRFDNDTAAGASTCTGQCAAAWPAATTTGSPTAGAGVDAAKLTTFTRSDDGKTQLQIDGHPLYTFAGDKNPGDTNGQGVIGKWYAAGPSGDKVGDKS